MLPSKRGFALPIGGYQRFSGTIGQSSIYLL
jgi:hypothetical protein